MKLVLLATTLLYYTQATETKKCGNYAFTKKLTGLDNMKTACDELNGIIASEDLKDSENAEKAEVAIKTFRGESDANKLSSIALGITAKDVNKPLDENDNNFAYSDKTDFDVSSFPYKWYENGPDYDASEYKCVHLRGDEVIANYLCASLLANALCFVEEDCEVANSDSERSRLNLPVFVLFMAGSVFKIVFALVGPAF